MRREDILKKPLPGCFEGGSPVRGLVAVDRETKTAISGLHTPTEAREGRGDKSKITLETEGNQEPQKKKPPRKASFRLVSLQDRDKGREQRKKSFEKSNKGGEKHKGRKKNERSGPCVFYRGGGKTQGGKNSDSGKPGR